MNLLEVKNLTKEYGGVRALNRCTLDIQAGEITAIIGPNGAGKTTLFNIISGFEAADKGQVIFEGEDITGLAPHLVAQHGLIRTFQLGRLFRKMSVLENVLLARPHRGERWWQAFSLTGGHGKNAAADGARALAILKDVGIGDKASALAESLSFGQQKLLEIARTLATEASVLLLDEPMAGVHPSLRAALKNVIRALHKEGKNIVFIEHDMQTVADLAERVIVLAEGRVIAQGTFKQISRHKKVIQAYLGKA